MLLKWGDEELPSQQTLNNIGINLEHVYGLRSECI